MPGIYNQTGQHGDLNQAVPVWKAVLVVNPGDFVFRDVADGYDKSALLYTWDTNLATTQASFHDVFRGVSMARRVATQLTDGGRGDGNILTSGEFTVPCAALGAAATPGELVTIAQGTGNTLNPQKVVVTTTVGLAIGVISQDAAVGATFLTFKLLPVISESRGVQAIQ